jgi:hypothetical protein
MMNSYLTLEKDPASGKFHFLLSGFEDATRIINGVNMVHVSAAERFPYSPLTIVPTYPDLPMEEVFPRPQTKKDPGVYVREVGRGRVVYFPMDLDRTFWEVLDVDHSKLLRNAVLWATNEKLPVAVKGPGVLDVSVWTQRESMTVHLVNLTNPMMMKGPVRDIIPVGAQQVSIRVPGNRTVSAVRSLVADRDVPHRQQGDFVLLEVPSIALHEVIAIDFRG